MDALELINQGLVSYIGDEPLTSLTDPVGVYAFKVYNRAVQEIAQQEVWGLSLRSAELALETSDGELGYTNKFRLPSDFSSFNLSYASTSPTVYVYEPYYTDGSYLYTDADAMFISYGGIVKDFESNTLLMEMLSIRIAELLVVRITGSQAERERLTTLYQGKLQVAIYKQTDKVRVKVIRRYPHIEARY